MVDSSLQTVGLFAKADENDNPQALVKESNETLRSEIKPIEVGYFILLFFMVIK